MISFLQEYRKWANFTLFEFAEVPISIKDICVALLILVATHFFSRGVRKAFHRLEGKIDAPTMYVFDRCLHYVISILGLLLAISSVGLSVRSFAIVLGALGVGIGFGLQNIVSNFVCGLLILFQRPFKVGDMIEVESGILGRVVDIAIQNTTVTSTDGCDILLPNASLLGKKLVNWTGQDEYRRVHIPFGVAYGSDLEKLTELLRDEVQKLSFVVSKKGKEPNMWLSGFGDNALNCELIVWVDLSKPTRTKSSKSDLFFLVEKVVRENGYQFPFPQRDVHVIRGDFK